MLKVALGHAEEIVARAGGRMVTVQVGGEQLVNAYFQDLLLEGKRKYLKGEPLPRKHLD